MLLKAKKQTLTYRAARQANIVLDTIEAIDAYNWSENRWESSASKANDRTQLRKCSAKLVMQVELLGVLLQRLELN